MFDVDGSSGRLLPRNTRTVVVVVVVVVVVDDDDGGGFVSVATSGWVVFSTSLVGRSRLGVGGGQNYFFN